MNEIKKNPSDDSLEFLEDKKSIIYTNKNDIEKWNSNVSQIPFANVRPWVRFLARHIDIYIFAIIICGLWMIISPSIFLKSRIMFGLITIFIWIFVESVFLSSWGTTFGKWLLKIKVRDKEDKKLTFLVALKRSFLVYLKGYGLGMPIISIFTELSAYNKLINNGITTWDEDCQLVVSHQAIGIIRSAVAIILIGIFFLLISLGNNIT